MVSENRCLTPERRSALSGLEENGANCPGLLLELHCFVLPPLPLRGLGLLSLRERRRWYRLLNRSAHGRGTHDPFDALGGRHLLLALHRMCGGRVALQDEE